MAANQISERIADYYDSMSGFYEENFGDHMHRGFYDPDQQLPLPDRKAAQIRMIEEALSFAGVSEEEDKRPRRIIDVGCGLGGSSRYLARKYGASVKGITNSPISVNRCIVLTSDAGLTNQVEFKVADAANMPFPDGHFDLVWAMEIAEHMPDKEKFVSEVVRVAAPGGHIIIVTACHRDLLLEEDSLKPDEQELLDMISEGSHLPAWWSSADHVKRLRSLHLEDIKTADWSKHITPSLANASGGGKSVDSLVTVGEAQKTALALAGSRIVKAYSEGLVRYSIISARKAT